VIAPLNLSELASEITSLLQTSIPRTVELRLQLQHDLPSIEGDAAQLQQLIMNLVINAAEAVEEGQTETVWIITRLEEIGQAFINQMISPNGAVPGKYVTLEVRDAGCGMDAETLSRIFDPFFTTKFTGRGLGLAAVMGMVRGHKGALHVESAPGKGSCFKVLFPIIAGPAASIVQSAPERSLAGDETILVIDDEDTVRQAAKSALESYGYKVVVAANGKEAVDLFQELAGKIDAVLLDMTMPVMSGEEALARLKSIQSDIPVVLSSGYNEADATRRFTGKKLAGFIQKPYTAASLAEKMKIALEINATASYPPPADRSSRAASTD
jgi:CheY-like chemotaxis protein